MAIRFCFQCCAGLLSFMYAFVKDFVCICFCMLCLKYLYSGLCVLWREEFEHLHLALEVVKQTKQLQLRQITLIICDTRNEPLKLISREKDKSMCLTVKGRAIDDRELVEIPLSLSGQMLSCAPSVKQGWSMLLLRSCQEELL